VNILLVNHYAGSPTHGMEYRPYYMARAWQKLGHRVRVVASAFSHVRTVQPQPVDGGMRLERVDGVEYAWVAGGSYAGNGLGRVRNMAGFVAGLLRHTGRITADFAPDAVISSSTYPLDSFAAHRIARRYGARLVHEVHDLWPLSPMELGNMSRWHPFIAVMQVAEEFAYRKADQVVSMLPKAEEHMRRHGLAAGKFVYVPNGVDAAEWEAAAEPVPTGVEEALGALRNRFPFLVGYAGAHGVANALGALIQAAALLKDDGVGVVVVGQGPEKESLRRQAERLAAGNVLFLDAVKKSAVPALLKRMDALYIGLQRQPLFRFGVSPNKLMDYMMAAKPVIHAIEAGNDLVVESGCGLSVAPEDPAGIADAVRRLAGMTADARRAVGERGRRFVLEHHSYDVLSKRFLNALGA
jgi:glycosyltransferase involved in cell wall biosynthesis